MSGEVSGEVAGTPDGGLYPLSDDLDENTLAARGLPLPPPRPICLRKVFILMHKRPFVRNRLYDHFGVSFIHRFGFLEFTTVSVILL